MNKPPKLHLFDKQVAKMTPFGRTVAKMTPCARGVLDPIIIPCPMGRSCSIRSSFYLEASLGALDPESVLLGGSLVDSRCIAVVGRYLFF